MKYFFLLFTLFFVTGCSDGSIVTVYDKEITKHPIACMKLSLHPEDIALQNALKKYYHFTPSCPLSLHVSYKSSIVCNSHYNAQQKALSNFPNSYLNMELRKGLNLEYSYYIDLDHTPTPADIKKGLARMREDLQI